MIVLRFSASAATGRIRKLLPHPLNFLHRRRGVFLLHQAVAGRERGPRRPRRSRILHRHAAEALERLVGPPDDPQRLAGVEPRGRHGVAAGKEAQHALEAGHAPYRRPAASVRGSAPAVRRGRAPSARSRYPDSPSTAGRRPPESRARRARCRADTARSAGARCPPSRSRRTNRRPPEDPSSPPRSGGSE